jgi:hypothetical protein
MSNKLNLMVAAALAEEMGYAGVEMYNDKFPTSQDNGNNPNVSKTQQGNAVVNQSNSDDSTYAKFDTLPGNKTMGDLVLDMVSSKNPDFQKEYPQNVLDHAKNGNTVLQTYGNK